MPRSVQGKAPNRQFHSSPIAVSGSGYTGSTINSLQLSSICESASQAVLGRMQPRAWCKQCLPGP